MIDMRFFKSLIEVVGLAYLTTFVGLVAAAGFDYLDLGAWKAAGVAAVPAALVAAYGVLAGRVGNRASALAVDTRSAVERTGGTRPDAGD